MEERLGVSGHYCQVQDHGVAYCLHEPEMAYKEHFEPVMGTLSDEKTSPDD